MMMRFLRQFWQNERGSVAIEGLFGGLLLLGWYMIAFQFYDAFRVRTIALRASYTVGDLISREINAIGPKYVDGTKKVFDRLTNVPNSNYSWLRVTLISCERLPSDARNCDGTTRKFTLVASDVSTGSTAKAHTSASINAEHGRIPILGAGDSAVVLETSMFYWPLFAIGDKALRLGDHWTSQGLSSKIRLSNFVVTRPRGPRTVWDNTK